MRGAPDAVPGCEAEVRVPGPDLVAALTAPSARVQEGTRPIRAEAELGAEAAPTTIESGIRIFISGGVRRAANQSGAS